MAVRISIGAGRARLFRLVVIESAWIAAAAALLGGAFAWFSAPLVAGMINPPNNPARLDLSMDWRLMLFGALLTACVTGLFGLLPALRASNLDPAGALKGGSADPHSRRRVMHGLIAAQVAFCTVVVFLGGLFGLTYRRIASQPAGFAPERLLAVEVVPRTPQLPVYWQQLSEHIRSAGAGAVSSVEISEWPLMSGEMHNNFIAFNGGPPVRSQLAYSFRVSAGWRESMRIPLLSGRDLRPSDTFPHTVLVNEQFVKAYFPETGQAVGRTFELPDRNGKRHPVLIAGVTADARYNSMRNAIPPTMYAPYAGESAAGRATLNVRMSPGADERTMGTLIRQAVTAHNGIFRVTNIRVQQELLDAHTLRERMIAMLAAFFSLVALTLAAVGLYGVLEYSVLERRREIGIRLALGARPGGIAMNVALSTVAMAGFGVALGIIGGVSAERYLEGLLFQVHARDWFALASPACILAATALAAALPPALRAVRLDPWTTLRRDG